MNTLVLLIAVWLGAWSFFELGRRSVSKFHGAKRAVLAAIAVAAALPGIFFTLYYTHWFDRAVWFLEFRSMPYSELTAAGAGLLAGIVAGAVKDRKFVSAPFLLVLLLLWLAAPYLKPLLVPIPEASWQDRWQDGVCLQSTPSSCGPASAAAVLKQFGIEASEQELAGECLTSRSGTENWYLARMFRHRGLTIRYREEPDFPGDLRLPAIAGVRLGGIGHFIAILDKEGDTYRIGDPLTGQRLLTSAELLKKYNFTGFFMETARRPER